MLVDRALAVDQHRAMAVLVVAEEDVAGGQSRCREQQLGGDAASVSVSSGPMWMNCDDVQQAVQPPHGTSDPCSPRSARCMPASHAEKLPAVDDRLRRRPSRSTKDPRSFWRAVTDSALRRACFDGARSPSRSDAPDQGASAGGSRSNRNLVVRFGTSDAVGAFVAVRRNRLAGRTLNVLDVIASGRAGTSCRVSLRLFGERRHFGHVRASVLAARTPSRSSSHRGGRRRP